MDRGVLGASYKTIALVDDSEVSLHIFTAILSRSGYLALPIRGGQRALELLKSVSPPDLLLVDYEMPGMNGVEFLKELKKIQPSLFYKTRVAGFSSYSAGSFVHKEYLDIGAGYIEKSFQNTSELISQIGRELCRPLDEHKPVDEEQ